MKCNVVLLSFFAIYLSACQTQPQVETNRDQSTSACVEYRAMMTAPLPPQEMNKLKQKCLDSHSQNN